MPTKAPVVDLDAPKRETQFPDGIPVKHTGVEFLLPAELPADCLDPILDLDLPSVLKMVMDALPDDDDKNGRDLGEVIIDLLIAQPALPKDLVDAIKGDEGVFAQLFGPEQFPTFVGNRPSINDYLRLAQALMPLYGVSLGEALGSRASSESDGETSSPTSSSTTDSTPVASGRRPKKKASSGSAASAA